MASPDAECQLFIVARSGLVRRRKSGWIREWVFGAPPGGRLLFQGGDERTPAVRARERFRGLVRGRREHHLQKIAAAIRGARLQSTRQRVATAGEIRIGESDRP